MSPQSDETVKKELGTEKNQDDGLSESDTNEEVTPEDLASAFTGGPADNKDELEAKKQDQTEQEKGESGSEKESDKKKHTRKKVWIGLSIIAWLLLIGGAVLLAFYLRPKIEIATDEEAFKWNEVKKEAVELVDVDFYSFYDTNAIEFYFPYRSIYDKEIDGNSNPDYNVKLQFVPQIKGLKNHEVQEKINNRIISVAQSISVPNDKSVRVHIGCNMFNVLSLLLSGYDEKYTNYYTGLSFDLTTGDELAFDDIFVKGANVESMVFKRFYNQLSSNYSFEVLYAERGIQEWEAGNCSMWCDEKVSLEEYRVRKENAENSLANIEEIAMNETKKYLAGEKPFYLENAGPVFIFDNTTKLTDCFMADDVGFFAYLGKYRTDESIYEDESVGVKHLFLSAVNAGDEKYGWIEEGDKYFVDYLTEFNDENRQEEERILRDLIEKIIDKSDNSKYHYILITDIGLHDRGDYWAVHYNYYVYEMDKEYYDRKFRKAIFEGKTHRAGVAEPYNPIPKKDMYDDNKVAVKTQRDYEIPEDVFLGKDGILYEEADDVFISEARGKYVAVRNGFYVGVDAAELDWRNLLINYYYANAYYWEMGRQIDINYTAEEKANHEFRFKLTNGLYTGAIRIEFREDNGNFKYGTTVDLSAIPNEYLKDAFKH
ncbi:MAG: hypothetical protein Q4A70_03865 [Candidatus Saccharibacteria bacterium]|nr:hypothetical protein [Candidatus Saccharibacteria bacterium]